MFQTPDIWKYTNAKDYLAEFVRMNGEVFTHRKFANEIAWPPSLLGDFLAGRRALSIARAAEFAQFFEMDGPSSERLIFFCMREVEGASLQEYIDDYFATEGEAVAVLPLRDQAPKMHVVAPELLSDFAAMALHSYMNWCGGSTSEEDIVALLGWIPALATVEKVRGKLALLAEAGVLSGQAPQFHVEHPRLVSSRMRAEDFAQTFDAIKEVLKLPRKQTCWNQGKVVFPRAKHSELIRRIHQLRNWILNTAIQAEAPGDRRGDSLPLQIHLCVSHMVDLSKLGIRIDATSEREFELVADDENRGAAVQS